MKAANRRPEKPDRQETDCECALESQSGGKWRDIFEAGNQPWTQIPLRSRNDGRAKALCFLQLSLKTAVAMPPDAPTSTAASVCVKSICHPLGELLGN